MHSTIPDPDSALLTDLYQLTMLQAYYREDMQKKAVFEFYVRRLPEARNFLIAAGLEQVLDWLESLQFGAAEIDWLRTLGRFDQAFLEHLRDFRFGGDVFAMREGTVCFANEPLLRVEASLPEAQFIESRLVNLLHYQTLVASKAARCRLAAGAVRLIDFGMRRAHGSEAALLASRASYIAGVDATATVAAAARFKLPLAGTMAHSFVQAHELETSAFRNFARAYSGDLVLLIDTYDIERGARRAVQVAHELGIRLHGVRIDSGDLALAARRTRAILDSLGSWETRILVSGNIDEYSIAMLLASAAPIDAFCVGTRISVSEDAPSLDCAYKLHQYDGRPCRKRSLWKETWPGPRQVYRQLDPRGKMERDLLCCADEAEAGRPLLHQVMSNGRRQSLSPDPAGVRTYCQEEMASLPDDLRSLQCCQRAIVEISQRQQELARLVDSRAT